MRGNEWIQLEFETGLDVGRVELFMRDRPSLHDPELQLWTTEDGRTYSPARMVAARPGLLKQAAAGSRLSQLLVLEGKPIRGLRILQLGARTEPWAISELRVDALAKR
jgi:hypothetical protein